MKFFNKRFFTNKFFQQSIFTKRFWRFLYQRLTRGWDDGDLWGLDTTIAKFTIPRLKEFRNKTCSFPSDFTFKGWLEAVDDMIYALETSADDDLRWDKDRDWDRVKKGHSLFGQYFMDLWW
jgi:hypothetical protein